MSESGNSGEIYISITMRDVVALEMMGFGVGAAFSVECIVGSRIDSCVDFTIFILVLEGVRKVRSMHLIGLQSCMRKSLHHKQCDKPWNGIPHR